MTWRPNDKIVIVALTATMCTLLAILTDWLPTDVERVALVVATVAAGYGLPEGALRK